MSEPGGASRLEYESMADITARTRSACPARTTVINVSWFWVTTSSLNAGGTRFGSLGISSPGSIGTGTARLSRPTLECIDLRGGKRFRVIQLTHRTIG